MHEWIKEIVWFSLFLGDAEHFYLLLLHPVCVCWMWSCPGVVWGDEARRGGVWWGGARRVSISGVTCPEAFVCPSALTSDPEPAARFMAVDKFTLPRLIIRKGSLLLPLPLSSSRPCPPPPPPSLHFNWQVTEAARSHLPNLPWENSLSGVLSPSEHLQDLVDGGEVIVCLSRVAKHVLSLFVALHCVKYCLCLTVC